MLRGAGSGIVKDHLQFKTKSSAMAESPRELGDFEGVGHFEAKF